MHDREKPQFPITVRTPDGEVSDALGRRVILKIYAPEITERV